MQNIDLFVFNLIHIVADTEELATGCPKKHGNSVTNSISSFLWISIVIPNFKSHNIIMSATVYFMQRCVYNVSARWTVKTDKFTRFLYCNFLVLLITTICSQNKNKQIVNISDKNLTDYSFLSRYHFTKSKNYLKDDIEFVIEFPYLLGHPVCTLLARPTIAFYSENQITVE